MVYNRSMQLVAPTPPGSSAPPSILPSPRKVEPVHEVVKEEPEKPEEKDVGQTVDTYA
jgi:hypothetical protein